MWIELEGAHKCSSQCSQQIAQTFLVTFPKVKQGSEQKQIMTSAGCALRKPATVWHGFVLLALMNQACIEPDVCFCLYFKIVYGIVDISILELNSVG